MQTRTVGQAIAGHDNHYTWLRLLLSSSIIYYHAFGLTRHENMPDHITALLWPVTTVGGLAVQSFFFLSGLFVAQSYQRDPRFVSFVIKRALRIWPGLFVCLLVTALAAALLTGPSPATDLLLTPDFYRYVLSNSVFEFLWVLPDTLAANRSQVLNGSIHTLPLEAKMYMLLGVCGLIGLVASRWRIGLAGAVLGVLCFVPGTLDRLPLLNLFAADYARTAICMFLAGMVAWGVSAHYRPRLWHGLALGLLAMSLQGSLHVAGFYAFVCWALLYLGQSPWLDWLPRPRHDLSYGIYLYGWPSQQLFMALFPQAGPYTLMAGALAMATALAWLSWHWVEAPAIQLGKALGNTTPRRERLAGLPARARGTTLGLLLALGSCAALWWWTLHGRDLPVIPLGVQVLDYGPRTTEQGQAINQQPDGRSALWVRTEGLAPAGTMVVFDGKALPAVVGDGLVTAIVPNALLARTGDIPIWLEVRDARQVQRSTVFILAIKPRT